MGKYIIDAGLILIVLWSAIAIIGLFAMMYSNQPDAPQWIDLVAQYYSNKLSWIYP